MGIVLILLICKPLLRFIPTVTGLQCQPKYCHIWDASLRDHALWPRGKPDGEEANTEMSLVCVIFIAFSLFSPLHGLSDSLCVYTVSPCMWVALDPPLPSLSSFHQPSLLHDPIYYWNQSSTPPPHALKAQAQAQPRPRDPCPHHGSWIMYGGIQWDEGFATAPTVTYITPVALSIPCDLPVCGQMYPHVYTHKLHVLPKDNTISEMCRY